MIFAGAGLLMALSYLCYESSVGWKRNLAKARRIILERQTLGHRNTERKHERERIVLKRR